MSTEVTGIQIESVAIEERKGNLPFIHNIPKLNQLEWSRKAVPPFGVDQPFFYCLKGGVRKCSYCIIVYNIMFNHVLLAGVKNTNCLIKVVSQVLFQMGN